MTNKAFTRNGLAALGPGGLVQLLPDPDAPNGVDLNETVSCPGEVGARQVTVTLPAAEYSGYSLLTFVWRAIAPDGTDTAATWTMEPVAGDTVLGPADNGEAVFGACAGLEPRYEMFITDTSGRMGYSRGLQSVAYDEVAFTVNANPIITGTPTEGDPVTFTPLDYVGEEDVTISYVYQLTEDTSDTNPGTEFAANGLVPNISGARDCFRIGAYANGTGTSNPSGPYWSASVEITPAAVSVPVSQTRATIVASNRIALDARTGALPVAGGTLTSGTASATIVAYVADTATTGTLYTGPIANSTIADNAPLSWAGGGALANGAAAAWQITGGESFYILPGTYTGDVTAIVVRQEIADDSSGTNATLLDLSGSMPPHFGTKFYRYTQRVSGYGIATYTDFTTGWLQIGIPTLSALVASDWFVETALDGLSTRVTAVWVRDNLNPSIVRWTTATQASIDANPYPTGHELCTLTATTQTVNSILYRKWTTADAIFSGKNYTLFIAPDDDARRTRFGVVAEIGGARTPLGDRKTIDYLGTSVGTSDTARLIDRSHNQAVRGEPGGAGMQFPRGYAVDGDYVFTSYDVTFPSESLNFGGDWYGDDALGLFAGQSTEGGVAFGGKYVVFMMSNLFMRNLDTGTSGNFGSKEGIYRKNRETNTWTHVQPLTTVYGSNDGGMRYQMRRVAVVPGSGAEGRTLFALYAPGNSPTTFQIYKSTDSGATWAADGGTVSVATHGNPLWLEADSTALYIATKTGVSRRPFSNTTWTRATGIPSSNTTKIQKVGSKVYASSRSNGLYVANDAATLVFSRIRAQGVNDFSVCPTNPNRIIITGSSGDRGVYTSNAGTDWFPCPSQPYDGQPNNFAHNLNGPPAWVQFHDTDPNRAIAMRNQHKGRSLQWPPVFEWASNNEDYSELRTIAFHRTDYRTFFLGMTDRLGCFTSHGALFVMDDAITDANKDTLHSLTGNTGALSVRGAILFDRGTRIGIMGQIGGNISQKVPVFFSRSVTTSRTSTSETGNGAISVTASTDLPAGPYVLTCTTAGGTGVGKFTGVAPFQESMGQWTVGTPKTFTHSRGGTLAVTISDGAVDFTAGANPAVFTITVNPIGGPITILDTTVKSAAWYGGVNPALGYRGISGRHIFEMATDGTITRIGGISQEFAGFMGTTGNVIVCSSGNNTLYRGVSSDSGQSYTLTQWATNLGNFIPRAQPLVIGSSHNDQRAYVGLADGTVKKIQNGVATTVFNFNTWRTANGIAHDGWPGLVRNGFPTPGVCGVSESFQDPNILYATVYLIGGHYLFFKTENGLDASPTWVDITRDEAGRGLLTPTQVMEIHPLTGEVFLLSSHGSVMRRPPLAHRTLYSLPSLVSDLQAAPGGDYHITSKI